MRKLTLGFLAAVTALVALLGLLNSGAQVTYADGQGCTVNDVAHGGHTITGTKNDDVIDCRGATTGHTISGGGGNDIIYGSGHRDIISGGAKNDTIYGEGGDDLLCGGVCDSPAASSLVSDGADLLYVGSYDASSPVGFAALGSFTFTKGGSGDDTIYGGEGNDTIIAGSGDDKLYGENGNDILHGGNHSDMLFGGPGEDELNGGHHNDMLDGGADNDTCNGGAGRDTLTNCEP